MTKPNRITKRQIAGQIRMNKKTGISVNKNNPRFKNQKSGQAVAQRASQQSIRQKSKNGYLNPESRRSDFLVFGAPQIHNSEIEAVLRVMETGWLGTGPRVAQFEEEFRKYKGAGFAVALNSCTAALHLSLLASGVKPGDEVITTPLTFCATVNAIIHSGAKPVLADVDPATMNINPREIEARITPRTRAILPVHFAGRSCKMDAIMKIARKHGLMVIEDCAHAIETTFQGQPVGTFGDFGCFSFYVTKNVVTGEGGMVLTKREPDAGQIKVLGLHGMSKDAWKRFSDEGYKHYQVVAPGFKYNMMDLAAAIGIEQLRRVEPNWRLRKKVWQAYNDAFSGLPIKTPADPEPGNLHAFHLYTIQVDRNTSGITRDEFLTGMTKQNIGVGVHYQSIPEHPYYQEALGWKPEDYPHAMKIGREIVSLPISARLTSKDIDDVIRAVKNLVA
jgi:dTDP-4-amino-4,6-dideoxygalactose transaminase